VKIHGHIGYGIRPSERKKGYATMMLKLALEHCKKVGLEKVLLTCDKSNLASAKTIMKCSGVFENEEKQNDGDFLQRYWIELI
jgi:predicted acetyltransferase